jgi:hypothetical protein
MLPISSGIPKPSSSVYNIVNSRRKYPFDQLDVGDMFFLAERAKNNISTLASITGKKLGMTFSTRLLYMKWTDHAPSHANPLGVSWQPATAETENAVLGIGVWRDA